MANSDTDTLFLPDFCGLRRVLTLLVDWVEREERMATPRDSAAA